MCYNCVWQHRPSFIKGMTKQFDEFFAVQVNSKIYSNDNTEKEKKEKGKSAFGEHMKIGRDLQSGSG